MLGGTVLINDLNCEDCVSNIRKLRGEAFGYQNIHTLYFSVAGDFCWSDCGDEMGDANQLTTTTLGWGYWN